MHAMEPLLDPLGVRCIYIQEDEKHVKLQAEESISRTGEEVRKLWR